MAFFLKSNSKSTFDLLSKSFNDLESFNFEKNCKPIKMTLTWNSPNYFFLKTKNTQNTLTTIYSKQILVPNTYPTFHWLSRKSLKTVMMIIKCVSIQEVTIFTTQTDM